jgi:RND family efflux transporter MFP subunit
MDLNRLKIERSSAAPRRRGRRSRWLPPALMLAGAGAALFIFWTPIALFVDRLRLPAVEVVPVSKRSAAEGGAIGSATANGYIVARIRAALSADTPGRIVELNVVEGQAVKKGFVVARLYADEYAAALRQAEADVEVGAAAVRRAEADRRAAELEVQRLRSERQVAAAAVEEARAARVLAEAEFERTRLLVEEGNESEQRLDERRAELDGARARADSAAAKLRSSDDAVLEREARLALAQAVVDENVARAGSLRAARDLAKATLEKTEVRAPFDGVVVLKDAEVGEVVSPNVQAGGNARGSVATLVDFRTLEVQAEVPETSLAAVRAGAPARVFLDAFPERPYKGRVDRLWPTANRQKATVEVRVAIEDPDERLRPEMGARVVFIDPSIAAAAAADDAGASGKETLWVPEDALAPIDGKLHVFVIERDTARQRAVELGERRGDLRAVMSGLSGDEDVVLRPPPTLEDGDRVLVKDRAR